VLLFIFEVQEKLFFLLTRGERDLLFLEGIVIFLFFAKQEGVFAGESWGAIGGLYLVIDEFMSGPFCFARVVSEVDSISDVFA